MPRVPRFIVGIDEVGRGPLAGPVVVAAVMLPWGLRLRRQELRDSKKLTPAAREEWAGYIREHPRIFCAIGRTEPAVIDKLNISRAANLAAGRAFARLAKTHGLTAGNCRIYLDGGLYLSAAGRAGQAAHPFAAAARTVIRGDEKIRAVAMASIVAKVHRDRLMARLSGLFPEYGFDFHKGYATRAHRDAVLRLGPSPVHRLTFTGKSDSMLANSQ